MRSSMRCCTAKEIHNSIHTPSAAAEASHKGLLLRQYSLRLLCRLAANIKDGHWEVCSTDEEYTDNRRHCHNGKCSEI